VQYCTKEWCMLKVKNFSNEWCAPRSKVLYKRTVYTKNQDTLLYKRTVYTKIHYCTNEQKYTRIQNYTKERYTLIIDPIYEEMNGVHQGPKLYKWMLYTMILNHINQRCTPKWYVLNVQCALRCSKVHQCTCGK